VWDSTYVYLCVLCSVVYNRKYKRPEENLFDLTDEIWNTFQCKHRYDPAVCRCRRPIYHVGQDEAILSRLSTGRSKEDLI
jgi:hypothetical protein